ncbi:MAG: flippase-like domain-containing protein [Dehalococcoidia bacterium]|nr:flippase-like domain-containing protein [Dehalococcoidia bacterium]
MPGSERLQRWLKFLVAIGISVFFSILFIRSVDLDAVGKALSDANYLYVLPALGLFALSVAMRALRWRYFLLPGFDLGWRALLPSVLIGYAGNNLLPLRAGELVRAQHLSDRFGVPRMQTFGALLMERLFDGFLLATFVLWGLLLVDIGKGYLGLGLALAAGTAVGGVTCFLLARRPGFADWLAALPIPFVTTWLRGQIAGLGASFFQGFSVLTSPGRFAGASVTSVVAWGLELAMYWLIAEAFALDASLITVAFAGAAANVSLSLPSAQGGVGPFEVFATEALARFDVAKDAAAAYALALHFFLIVPVSLVGLAVLWRSTLTGTRRQETASTVAEAQE